MTKHPTAAEKRATRDEERRAEMDQAFDDEVAKSADPLANPSFDAPITSADPVDLDPPTPAEPAPPVPAPVSVAPIDLAAQSGQIQRRVATLRAAAGDFHVPDDVLLTMAKALEPKP